MTLSMARPRNGQCCANTILDEHNAHGDYLKIEEIHWILTVSGERVDVLNAIHEWLP